MPRTILATILAPLIALSWFCDPARSLIGADLVDLSLQRYTVSVASTKGRCTGVVLAQNIVLTAAHCTRDAQNLWVGGNRGWGDLASPPVGLSPVTEIVVHPLFNPAVPHSPDLALLKLAKPLPDRFLPAFFGASAPREGDDLIAAGYGKSADNDPTAGKILRMDLLRVAKRYKDDLALVSTREEASGGARGDSGGPVFTYHGMLALVAIIVSGASRTTFAIPIAPNYAWIKETIERLSAS